ncbi:5'-nucleotidase domain-containing protein 2 [Puma concolor]|uniref:5'-nucleotidase domain-containing protein 2 n=1 Tax=Puma concolor TaxID=9696 RepID=A0A6P6H7N6_PUMCO|nr:5'-nucleotidase domain-containing protein 2 [Puma concolor]
MPDPGRGQGFNGTRSDESCPSSWTGAAAELKELSSDTRTQRLGGSTNQSAVGREDPPIRLRQKETQVESGSKKECRISMESLETLLEETAASQWGPGAGKRRVRSVRLFAEGRPDVRRQTGRREFCSLAPSAGSRGSRSGLRNAEPPPSFLATPSAGMLRRKCPYPLAVVETQKEPGLERAGELLEEPPRVMRLSLDPRAYSARCPTQPDHSSQGLGVAMATSPEGSNLGTAPQPNITRPACHLLPPEVCSLLNPAAIYANNEISLRDVEVYGFDYDYTLAQYADALHPEIFSAARDILIEHYKYPEGIRKYDYDPSFAIRGLHYDIQKSLLMKIDAFHYVQLGTAYRGLQPVPDEEVIDLYGGTQHIPLYQMSGFYGKGPSIKQFMDIFSLPEMALLSCVVDHFLSHGLEFDQAHLYKDVTDAIRDVHVKGLMYQWIEQDMEKYILRGDETFAVLSRLVAHGKQLFLITNSPFSFVDKGMRHMVGPDWRQLFDVVIVQADKPSFFTDRRKYGPSRGDEVGSLGWVPVVRCAQRCPPTSPQGNLYDFLRLTEWRGPRVLYFGDHLYSDLADLMLRHGWRTGAIIPELEREIRIINTEQYMHSLTWQQALTGLLERMQTYQDAESQQVLAAWMKERQELRCITKALFNAQFGSIFRTFHNPTYFSRRLVRFSDLYMASLSCLLNYRVDFTFYPRRTPLQHEAPLWMDQLCTGCMKTPFLGDMAHIR